jgi:hypothetical protein
VVCDCVTLSSQEFVVEVVQNKHPREIMDNIVHLHHHHEHHQPDNHLMITSMGEVEESTNDFCHGMGMIM